MLQKREVGNRIEHVCWEVLERVRRGVIVGKKIM